MENTVLQKNSQGYGYKYTDLAQIHEYLERNNMKYYQYIERIDNEDYIYTVPIINGEEQKARRGSKIVDAVLSGVKNPAQEQGSAITYARRYSLLMAFGLATEDNDAKDFIKKNKTEQVKDRLLTDVEAKRIHLSLKNKFLDDTKVVEYLIDKYEVENTSKLTAKQYNEIVNEMKNK